LPKHFFNELRHFFEEYKTLENKTVSVEEFGDKEMAMRIIEDRVVSLRPGIQQAAQTSAASIEGITRMIGKVNVTATAIASAVEQQSVAMREITSHVQQAAQGTHEVSDNISSVTQAARDTGAAAADVLASANEFGKNGSALQHQVDTFLHEVRVA
jgi:methyl-accepting chemotaxis protein